MGNLRQKYTDDEWDGMERQEREDRDNGKPQDFGHIAVFINRWTPEEMDRLYNVIQSIDPSAVSLMYIEKWIRWKHRNSRDVVDTTV